MNKLKKRILEISYKHKLSHIGSCLSVLPILEEIYRIKGIEDKVLMDNAHAHLAHSLFIEKEYGFMPELHIKTNGIHCDRRSGCDASGGSLGHALGIAIGMTLANPKIKIHVVVTDGSMMEGSNWEALRIIQDLELYQIVIYCNFNGYTAVSKYSSRLIEERMKMFTSKARFYHTDNGKGFKGLKGHYKIL